MMEKRKQRILMRGIKVGKQKGTGKIDILSVFEKKKE